VTTDEFRNLALELPEASEGSHSGHPDFRVGGKIFATIGPDEVWGMVKLSADRQAFWIRSLPEAFEMFHGAWGRQGCTKLILAAVHAEIACQALRDAWRNVAPPQCIQRCSED
jgi:hypothetical protein